MILPMTQEPMKLKNQSGLVQIVLYVWITIILISVVSCCFIAIGHCPSGDDPRTVAVETDCYNVTAKGSLYKGMLCEM